HHRHRCGPAHRRGSGDRERLRHPRSGPADRGRHPAPRLSPDPGDHPGVLRRLCADQPASRPVLHFAQSAHSLLMGAADEHKVSGYPPRQRTLSSRVQPRSSASSALMTLAPEEWVDWVRHNPTVAAGGTLLLVMLAVAALAPWLGTVD